MLLTSQDLRKQEEKNLAPYAVKNSTSKGREYSEPEDPNRLPFQRDRDRIIHAKAFRRLKGKTQVFVSHYGDHYRSRLTHTLEVTQLSRDIARSLGANEDLAESIALAHDLGHTPFGHAGEEALNKLMEGFDSHFEHNEQSKRIVELLEKKYPHFPGLNLTFEVRDGLLKHQTLYDQPKKEVVSGFLEAQIVNIADSIAYYNHDLDDGLRSNILTLEQLKKLKIWQRVIEGIESGLEKEVFHQCVVHNTIHLMVSDVYQATEKNLRERKIKNSDDILQNPELVAFSPQVKEEVDELNEFLRQDFYFNEKVYKQTVHGKRIIEKLFSAFLKEENLLPLPIRKRLEKEEKHVVVKDYIAGMTDNFALKLTEEL